MRRTQIPNNAAIRGFSTSFDSHTYTNDSSTSPMANDDMNVFNVNILPLLNTIKVFLTNFIKSKYSVACDNQYKSIEYHNTYITAPGQPAMPHKTTDNLLLHPSNKFHMDECSYIQFDCVTKTFSCLNYTGTSTENMVFVDSNPTLSAQNVKSFHCIANSKTTDLKNCTKDIEYLMAGLDIWPPPSTSQPPPQLPAKQFEPTDLQPKTPPATKEMNSGLANGGNGTAAGKSQHHRKKNRGKNWKTSTEVNNNSSQRMQPNCAEKKSNRKNRNRKRSNCAKAKTTASVSVDSNRSADIMCITTEAVVTDMSYDQRPSFSSDGQLLHQTNSDVNCFFTTMAMFINPFESDRPLARREQLTNSADNCRQRHISDSSDDFICFELSDNEIEPQMVYTSGCGNIWDSDRVNVNKCDYGSGPGKWWTNDDDTDDDENVSIGNKKKVC